MTAAANHHRQGLSLLQQGDPEAAQPLLTDACRLDPQNAAYQHDLGLAKMARGRFAPAAEHFAQAVALAPGNARYMASLGASLAAQGALGPAATALSGALLLAPDDPSIRLRAGQVALSRGQIEAAEEHFRRAYALVPESPEAAAGLARLLERKGEIDAAAALLSGWISASSPANALRTWAAICRRRRQQAAARDLLLAALERPHSPQAQALLRQGLGEVLEDLGEYSQAFHAYSRANDLQETRFDPAELCAQVSAQIRRYPGGAAPPQEPAPDGPRPVLIVGMPRSGTSLLEQILDRHPDVAGAGELDALRRLAGGSATAETAARYRARLARDVEGSPRWICDKMPTNFLHLGFAAELLPGARVISVERDPIDVGFSCFTQAFSAAHAWSQRLEWIGAYLAQHQRIMAHWRATLGIPLLTVRYEALVTDPEAAIREALAFLDLPWEPACLRPEESARLIHTASYAQVRQPIHAGSVSRASRFAAHLGPLREAFVTG